jgi:hypothetical protein
MNHILPALLALHSPRYTLHVFVFHSGFRFPVLFYHAPIIGCIILYNAVAMFVFPWIVGWYWSPAT